MQPEDAEGESREITYRNHARDEDGNHLPEGCPECERIEGLEKSAALLRSNCDALFETLKDLYERHGGCGCLSCMAAKFLISYVSLEAKVASLPPSQGRSPHDLDVGPKFDKIVSPEGYPVARFRSKIMSTEYEDGRYFLLDRESLAGIVERGRAEGKPAYEHERALKALDDAIQEWAQTPWDGR